MRARAALFLLLGALSAVRAFSREGVFYTRVVEVPSAGWVEVPLEVPDDRSLSGLRVMGPDGKLARMEEFSSTQSSRLPENRWTPARIVEAPYPAAPCRVGVTTAFCAISLPPVAMSRLTLEIAGSGPISYRLYHGVWPGGLREAGSIHKKEGVFPLSPRDGRFRPGEVLLLELSTASGSPLPLKGYRVTRLEGLRHRISLAFQAGTPGRYVLIYDDVKPFQLHPLAPAGVEVRRVEPGPESEHPLPPLPASALNPGARLSRISLARAWPIQAPGAIPGDIVRILIPEPLYAEHRGHPYEDWQVEAQGRELYSAKDLEPAPIPMVWLPGARPRPTGQAGISRIGLPLPSPGLPLGRIHLRAKPAPFHRKIQLVDDSSVVSEQSWTCLPDHTGSCALDFDLQGWTPQNPSRLSLRFLDGDNPPLPVLDIAVWRRREELTFVWPRSGPVRLLTGAERDLSSIRNDDREQQIDLDQEIRARPSRPARIGLPRHAESSAAPAFAAAGVLLLALLGWRSRRRLRPALALVALAALPGTARADAGRLYTRPVAVPSAGVVRVPLDLSILRHLGANGAGLRVFGPSGEEVPGWMEPYPADDPSQSRRQVVQPTIRQEGSAIVLGADLAQSPVPLHAGVWLEFGGPGSIQQLRARVEGSRDRETWKTLAEGDFSERPPADNNQRTLYLLTYPPSQDPFLRITIPAVEAVGFQGVSLGVLESSPRALSVPADRLHCESAGRRTWCRLELPARWQRPLRLALDLAGPDETAVRVYAVREGGLRPLAQAIRRSARGGSRFVLPILSGPLAAQALRIELQGAGGAPRVTGATLDLAQPVADFRAASPGVYELRYGDGRSYYGNNNDRPLADTEESVWIAPGPESARELPPCPGAPPPRPCRWTAGSPPPGRSTPPECIRATSCGWRSPPRSTRTRYPLATTCGYRREAGRSPASVRPPTIRPWCSPARDCGRSTPSSIFSCPSRVCR